MKRLTASDIIEAEEKARAELDEKWDAVRQGFRDWFEGLCKEVLLNLKEK